MKIKSFERSNKVHARLLNKNADEFNKTRNIKNLVNQTYHARVIKEQEKAQRKLTKNDKKVLFKDAIYRVGEINKISSRKG